MYRTVVVPLDGSEWADSALVPATHIARRLHADLKLVDTAAIDAAVDQFDAPLVCAAAGVRSHLGRPALGRLAAALLSELDGPMVLIGPRCDRDAWAGGAHMFACVDGSVLSEAVLPVAAAWAGSLDLTACLLHVVAPRHVSGPVAPGLPDGDVHESNYVAGLAKGLRRGGVYFEWEVVHGSAPARAIVGHAGSHAAALIALSSHSRPDTKGPLGRVALNVVMASPVPVLVARSQRLFLAVMSLAEPLRRTATGS